MLVLNKVPGFIYQPISPRTKGQKAGLHRPNHEQLGRRCSPTYPAETRHVHPFPDQKSTFSSRDPRLAIWQGEKRDDNNNNNNNKAYPSQVYHSHLGHIKLSGPPWGQGHHHGPQWSSVLKGFEEPNRDLNHLTWLDFEIKITIIIIIIILIIIITIIMIINSSNFNNDNNNDNNNNWLDWLDQ